MKEIIKQYGQILIAVLIFGVLVSLAYGVRPAMELIFAKEAEDRLEDEYKSLAYNAYMSRGKPKVILKDFGYLLCYTETPVDRLLESDQKVTVYGLYDQEGRNVAVRQKGQQQVLYFESPGIYELYYRVGEEGSECLGKIELPVNPRPRRGK